MPAIYQINEYQQQFYLHQYIILIIKYAYIPVSTLKHQYKLIIFGRKTTKYRKSENDVRHSSVCDCLMMTFLVLCSLILAYKGIARAEKQTKG